MFSKSLLLWIIHFFTGVWTERRGNDLEFCLALALEPMCFLRNSLNQNFTVFLRKVEIRAPVRFAMKRIPAVHWDLLFLHSQLQNFLGTACLAIQCEPMDVSGSDVCHVKTWAIKTSRFIHILLFLWLETNNDNWMALEAMYWRQKSHCQPESLRDCMEQKLSSHHQPCLLTWNKLFLLQNWEENKTSLCLSYYIFFLQQFSPHKLIQMIMYSATVKGYFSSELLF